MASKAASGPALLHPVSPEDDSNALDLQGTRGRILVGAMEVFDRLGVSVCTVEDILQASGISRGTFYQYFRNKEDVLATVFQYSTRLLVERVRLALQAVDEPFHKMECAVDVYLEMQREQGRLIHGMLVEALRPGSQLAELREWALQMLISFIDDTVYAMQRRRIDPLVYRGLLAAVEGLVIHTNDNPTPEQVARIRAAIIPIIERTLALPGDAVPELPVVAGQKKF